MAFRYLLLNAVPLGLGSAEGRYVAGALWLEDLRAQARALREVGGRLVAALPVADSLDVSRSGSFELREFVPADEGFEVIPLPAYRSWKEFLKVRGKLRRVIRESLKGIDVVQTDNSGHPFSLSRLAWTDAGREGCVRVWVFDGGDVVGQQRVAAAQTRSGARRVYRTTRHRWSFRFWQEAVRRADVVFTHNDSTKRHFGSEWGAHCHQLDRSYVTKEMIIDEAAAAERRRRYESGGSPLRFVVASRLIAIKAVDQALRAIDVARRDADVRLDIYGEGDALPELKALAAELGLDGVVQFHMPVAYGEPLFARLRETDVMLITNVVPELSRNYMLAMALGMPILSYTNPGSDSLMERSGAGRLVRSGDWRALAGAMVEMAKGRGEGACIDAGRQFAEFTTLEACHRKRAETVRACLDLKRGRTIAGVAAG